jgi:oligoendopeptidase F
VGKPPGKDEVLVMIAAGADAEVWDLSAFFPSLAAPEYRSFVAATSGEIDAFDFETAGLPALDDASPDRWVVALLRAEALEAKVHHLESYVNALIAADQTDEMARAEGNRANVLRGSLDKAELRLQNGLGAAAERAFASLCADPRLATAAWRLTRLRRRSATMLSAPEERLAADLAVDGFHRWGLLAQATASQLRFRMSWPSGETESLPVSYRYDLLWDARPEVRKTAFEGMNEAFRSLEMVFAAALNGIAGTRVTLARHRKTDVVVDACERNGVDRETIDAMLEVLHQERSRLHRYVGLKARMLGLESLGIYDRSAPLPVPELASVDLAAAKRRVLQVFVPCPPLVATTRRIFERRWLEAQRRPGKRTGAFCTSSPLLKQSRVFMSHGGSFNSVTTLAHEVGHAFHNDVLAQSRYWAQDAPLTLAETASNVAENLLRNAVIADAAAPVTARIGILGAQLDAAVNYLIRIPRDHEFEVEFYAERERGDVTAARLKELMGSAHRRWFSGALFNDGDDEMAWAYARHPYFTDTSFYNFPYVFGFLLSCRIAAEFAEKKDDFADNYVDFLRASGSMPVEEAVRSTLGYDVTDSRFWLDSFSVLDRQIDELENLWESSELAQTDGTATARRNRS